MKPDPLGLERVMARAGVEPGETLMVGDRDGAAARALGVDFLRRADWARAGDGVQDFTPASLGDACAVPAGGPRR